MIWPALFSGFSLIAALFFLSYSRRSPKGANLRRFTWWAYGPTKYALRTCADYEEGREAT